MGRVVPAALSELLTPFTDEVQEIALCLRSRVLAVVPNAHETVWDATNAVSCGYSPTPRWQDGIVHIATYASWVNLGFNDGAKLDDPDSRLVGSGSRIRHVRVASVAETDAAWIDAYVSGALTQAGLDGQMGDGGTTVRASSGVKRRPGAHGADGIEG